MGEAWAGTKYPLQHLARLRRRVSKQQPRPVAPTVALTDAEAALALDLQTISGLPPLYRPRMIEQLSRRSGLSPEQIKSKMAAVDRGGAAALVRKPRSDRGGSRVLSQEAALYFSDLVYTNKHQSVSKSIEKTRDRYPETERLSDDAFYRVKHAIPKSLLMTEREWNAAYLPTGRWEVAYPNHTWVFDFTRADLFVWDQDPDEKPYRPWLTAILDEHTRSCMYGLYTKETPSRAVLQAVLYHAIMPKTDEDGAADKEWIQCGTPDHLHCDNGKVQDSDWLKDVCSHMHADFGQFENIRHAPAYSPWHQGKIERFYGTVHRDFESDQPSYCGRSPEHKPESFDAGRRAWAGYPSLESINAGFRSWVIGTYHKHRNATVKQTPLQRWRDHAEDHIRVPGDTNYLYRALLQRAADDGTCPVRRGEIRLNTYSYYHARLQGYEGVRLHVRWDPAEMDRIVVYGLRKEFLLEARRVRTGNPDNPKDLAAHQRIKKEKRTERRAEKQTIQNLAGSPAEERERFQRKLAEEDERRAREAANGPIPFPVAARKVEPADGVEPSPDASILDDILAFTGAQPVSDREVTEEEELIVDGIRIP